METPDLRPAGTTPGVSTPQPKHPAFTCTFCWHNSHSPSGVVGRSARLACKSCYNALLDLSICWVCGEVVVRGDDCVSLGWCFWHKSCYGCLICGNRAVVHGLTVKEVFADGNDLRETESVDGLAVTYGRAKEIDQIPLCAHCFVAVGAEEMNTSKVVDGALGRMDHRDSGLTRRRYEEGRPTKANVPGWLSDVDKRELPGTPEPNIYVSISDPTGAVFKSSPTKPIPQWMSQGHETNDYERATQLTLDDHVLQHSPADLSVPVHRRLSTYTDSTDQSLKPHTPTPEPVMSPTTVAQDATAPIAMPAPISVVSPNAFRYPRAGFINSESLKRPSSRLNRIREESSHVESRTPSPYLTPPEWPAFMYSDNRTEEPEAATDFEYVTSQEPTVRDASDLASVFSDPSSPSLSSMLSPNQTRPPFKLPRLSVVSEPGLLPQHPRLQRKSTMLRAKIASHHPPTSPPAIPMSSEFLERYGLVKGREQLPPSALLKKTPPSSRRSSQQPQPIVARMAKNSRSSATTGLVDETTVVTETDRSARVKQFSLNKRTESIALHDGPALDTEPRKGRWRSHADPSRRRSLHAELKRLFRR